MAEGLRAVGLPGPEPPRRPVASRGAATLVTLATLDGPGGPVWHGLWFEGGVVTPVGPSVPACALPSRAQAAAPGRPLVDLMEASSLSLLEALEGIGGQLDALEASRAPPPLDDLTELQRRLARVRKHLFRLELLVAELRGSFGGAFAGIAAPVAEIDEGVHRSIDLATGLQQASRDLTALRSATEANRLAEAANALGRTSNDIAALANTSNLRMLGVAYVALVLALVSAVVLIPNTAATILGMPSAAWVPGLWVDVILVVLAIVPVVVVFSRPWVRRMLRGWGTYERRTSEGIADLPEVAGTAAPSPPAAEPLIPPRP